MRIKRPLVHRPRKLERLAHLGRKVAQPFKEEIKQRDRVFCISFQRCGTTSLGQFCRDQLNLTHRGYRHSLVNDWTRQWTNARHPDASTGAIEKANSRIFMSADFRSGQVFEDDPWWCPGMPEALVKAFPHARYVMFTRPANEWFRSMISHSGGRSPGFTDTHALIYNRWDEYQNAVSKSDDPDRLLFNGLSMIGMEKHYIEIYDARIAALLDLFGAMPNFLHLPLSDPDKFTKLANFLGHEGVFRSMWLNQSRPQSRT